MREDGWYWVKRESDMDWTPALWNGSRWDVRDLAVFITDLNIYEIDERRIVREEE